MNVLPPKPKRRLKPDAKIAADVRSTQLALVNTNFIDNILDETDEPTTSSNSYMPNIALLNQEKSAINANFVSYMQTIIPQMQIALSSPPFISANPDLQPIWLSILPDLQSYFNLSTNVPPEPPQFPNHPDPRPVYDNYLNNFNGHDIFTLKSEPFDPDGLYVIGRYDDPKNPAHPHKKYYEPGDFDTKCLLVAILYRILLQGNFSDDVIYKIISSYTDDPDPDDLYDMAEEDIYRVFTVYGIVKRITAFIETGQIDKAMKYLTALKEWIEEEAERAADPRISQKLLKRIGTMVELLWYILYKWPVIIPPSQQRNQEPGQEQEAEVEMVVQIQRKPIQKKTNQKKTNQKKTNQKKQIPAQENNVKLYAGIGTSSKDANYDVFVQSLFDEENPNNMIFFPSMTLKTDEQLQEQPGAQIDILPDVGDDIPQAEPDECFHDSDNPRYPERPGQLIISRDFVSTAYSFDAAVKFCKALGCLNLCMLEFILLSGSILSFVGSSANEAEVLLKPGNAYQFIKRYKVSYTRLNRGGQDELKIIFVYQFLLLDQNNTILPRKMPTRVTFTSSPNSLDLSKHKDWSETINLFIIKFGILVGLPGAMDRSNTMPSSKRSKPGAGGSNLKQKSKSNHKSKRKTKQKIQLNKRRKTKRRTNKRRTNKRRRI